MTDVTLMPGDCLELMPWIADGSIDMVLCDLPYGTTACKWDAVIPFDQLWAEYRRVVKPSGAIVLTASNPFTCALGASNLADLKYSWYWRKSRATGHMNAKKQPMKAHENVLVFYGKQATYNPQKTLGAKPYTGRGGASKLDNYGAFGTERNENTDGSRYPRSVLQIPSEGSTVHPTQKPVALMEYLIRTYTNPGDTVLDNTMGSGTTGVAAVNTGRHFIGIERDPVYFDIAEQRINEALK